MSAITTALAAIDEIGAEGEMDAGATPALDRARARQCRRSDPATRRQADLPAQAVRRADPRDRRATDRHPQPGRQPVSPADRPARNGQVAAGALYRPQAVARPRRAGDRTSRQSVLRAGGDAAAARPRTSTCSATSSCPPQSAAATCGSSTRRSSRDARRMAGDDRRGQHRSATSCLLSINGCLDGRLALYLPATAETVIAQPGFGVILAYNPGLVGAARHPRRVALTVSRPRSR